MIAFYSIVLNHHQAPLADALWSLTKGEYRFVELSGSSSYQKGGVSDYSSRPYLIQAWKDEASYNEASKFAKTADVCVFGGADALSFQIERMRLGLLSFEMGERWLKKGLRNLLSPRLMKSVLTYHLRGWRNRPLYKLCAGAYVVNDQYKLGTYKDRCFKWGYFTDVPDEQKSNSVTRFNSTQSLSMMWCSRFVDWKHPELPILLAQQLKHNGHDVVIDMYGDGEEWNASKQKIEQLEVGDVVHLHGAVANDTVLDEMRRHDAFLFTSDQNEGWGAVANEAMSCGCVLVASDAIGSVPYLVEDGKNGLVFHSNDVESLYETVVRILNHREELSGLSKCGVETIRNVWSPRVAAERFVNLVSALKKGDETPYENGPCSKANVMRYA